MVDKHLKACGAESHQNFCLLLSHKANVWLLHAKKRKEKLQMIPGYGIYSEQKKERKRVRNLTDESFKKDLNNVSSSEFRFVKCAVKSQYY